MAQALERDQAGGGRILFELETLEQTAANRLDVSGRWFGVRGRRFVRPSLTPIVDDDHHNGRARSLADLEHKPWPADDGELWTAAFPVLADADEIVGLELAVAPDIAVMLPPPGATRPPRPPGDRSEARPVRTRRDPPRQEPKPQHVNVELDRARVEVRSAIARRDAAVEKFESTAKKLESTAEKLEAVEHERKTLEQERDRIQHERDTAIGAARRVARERDAAISERDADAARVRRVKSAARTELAALHEQLRRERSGRIESPRAPDDAPEPVPLTPGPAPEHVWLKRAIAVAVLIAVLILLLAILLSR